MNPCSNGVFRYHEETHKCRLQSLVAGGQRKEAERGIFLCKCGIRWEEFTSENERKQHD